MKSTRQSVVMCGSGHSGSTLLNLILGSHPHVVSLGETTNMAQGIIEDRKCTCRLTVRACPFWATVRRAIAHSRDVDIFKRPFDFPVSLKANRNTFSGQFIHCQRQLIAALGYLPLAAMEFTPPGGISTRRIAQNILHLFDTIRVITGRQVVVDSSKESPLRMKWLWMVHPSELKVLYVVRDGRAVVASNKRRGSNTKAAVWSWVRTQTIARMMFRTMPKSAWLMVRYEDLCDDPVGELTGICRFLSLEYTKDMLEFRRPIHHDIAGNEMRFEANNEIVNRETWRQELSQDDLKVFERVAGPINRRLGYYG
jgi:hypothetical protein